MRLYFDDGTGHVSASLARAALLKEITALDPEGAKSKLLRTVSAHTLHIAPGTPHPASIT